MGIWWFILAKAERMMDDFTVVDNSFEGIERGLGRAKALSEIPQPRKCRKSHQPIGC